MVLVNDNHFKVFYHCGLKEWDYEKGYLIDTCLSAQDKYKAIWIILGLLMKIINQIEIDDYIVIEGKEYHN